MEMFISVLIAYVISGVAQVTKDLSANVIDRPGWARMPTLGKAVFAATTWPIRPILEGADSTGQFGRAIVFGALGIITQMVTLTTFVWGVYALAGLIFDNLALRVTLAAVIGYLGALFVMPLVSLLMVPVTLLFAWPLDLLFPLKGAVNAKKIEWCRTCKYYRKVREYEDVMTGLWRETSMPRSDKLPCTIALETVHVWEAYYDAELGSRTLFPRDCPHYERS